MFKAHGPPPCYADCIAAMLPAVTIPSSASGVKLIIADPCGHTLIISFQSLDILRCTRGRVWFYQVDRKKAAIVGQSPRRNHTISVI
jgi:hypothetical protein